jgi:phosphatidate cytidylyltransferase
VSPTIALHDDTFRRFVIITAALLTLAGVVLLLLRIVVKKDVRSVWLTYRSWLVIVPIIAATILLGREAVIVGAGLLAIFCFKEYARATGLYADWWITGVVYVLILACMAATLAGAWQAFNAMPIMALAAIFLVPVARNRAAGQLQSTALAVLGFVLVGWALAHLGWLARSRDPYGTVLFVIFATEICDVAAYLGGKLFGGRRMRSEISPKKTWCGSLTALALAIALPWLLAFSLPGFNATDKVLAGLIVGCGGQIGDLAISLIKRDLGVKDMGAALPGHGGLLDRCDSLLFVTPAFVHLLRFADG